MHTCTNWNLSRAACLAGMPLWETCATCAERSQLDAWCPYCDGRIAVHYRQSGGLADWRRFAHKSLATLEWDWLGEMVSSQIRGFAQALPEDISQGRGLLLAGKPGTGKTHIALGLGLVGLAYGFTVYATTLGSLLLDIRATFAPQERRNEQTLVESLSEVDLLILDDLGMEQPTPWAVEKLSHLVNDRYAAQKSLLITSNFHPARLELVWGQRLMSRLDATCAMLSLFDVDDFRPIERAESQGQRSPFLSHWPGTEAEVVVGDG